MELYGGVSPNPTGTAKSTEGATELSVKHKLGKVKTPVWVDCRCAGPLRFHIQHDTVIKYGALLLIKLPHSIKGN